MRYYTCIHRTTINKSRATELKRVFFCYEDGYKCFMTIIIIIMAKIVALSDLSGVKTNSTLKAFISSLVALNLENGTFFSGTITLVDFPAPMSCAEIHGVIFNQSLIDLTLTSTDTAPYRWTCSCWTSSSNPQWRPC